MVIERISPIDDRYWENCKEFKIFSEKSLFKNRIKVECEFLIHLSKHINNIKLSKEKTSEIRNIYRNYSDDDYQEIKEEEKKTNHDIKATENFIRKRIRKRDITDKDNMVHFGLTSEDVNNLSYSLILKEALEIIVKKINNIIKELKSLIKKTKDLEMLARTHGQPASPTTLGKELTNFLVRIKNHLETLSNFKLPGKVSGATGNYNSFQVAYPDIDWIQLTKNFVNSLNLKFSAYNTQIMPHDQISILLRTIKSLNLVIIDLNSDLWDYISREYFKLRTKENEVGSSTMPHKVNPIDFENSEGNLKMGNSLLTNLSDELQVSRLQRDLTDSTMRRNYGVPLAHSILGYKSLNRGIQKLEPNKEKIINDLEAHPEIITEAIQTILRREGDSKAYEKMKKFTRNKERSLEEIKNFIKELEIPNNVKEELLKITPRNYTGLATKLTEKALSNTNKSEK